MARLRFFATGAAIPSGSTLTGSIAEALVAGDTNAVAQILAGARTEAATLADTNAVDAAANAALSEAQSIADTNAVDATANTNVSEGVTAASSESGVSGGTVGDIAEAVSAGDTPSADTTANAEVSEAATLADSLSGDSGNFLNIAEAAGFSDQNAVQSVLAVDTSHPIAADSAVSVITAFTVAKSSSAAFSDTPGGNIDTIVALVDGLTAGDSFSGDQGILLSVPEGVVFADEIQRLAGATGSIQEDVVPADQVGVQYLGVLTSVEALITMSIQQVVAELNPDVAESGTFGFLAYRILDSEIFRVEGDVKISKGAIQTIVTSMTVITKLE